MLLKEGDSGPTSCSPGHTARVNESTTLHATGLTVNALIPQPLHAGAGSLEQHGADMTVLKRSEQCSFHDRSHPRFSRCPPRLTAYYLLRSFHCSLGFQILFQGCGLSNQWVAQPHTHFKSKSKRGPLFALSYNKGSVLYVKVCLKAWATPVGEEMRS